LQLKFKETLIKNKMRYIALVAGFFLFVAPFALFSRLVYYAIGNLAEPTLHTICLRMPIDWIFSGRYYSLFGSVMAAFVIGVILLSFFLGPVFCGWLCPVGAVSEGLSRVLPIPSKFRLKVKDPKVTRGLRFGFLTGFIAVAAFAGFSIFGDQIASICCRYCASSTLQNLVDAAFGNALAIEYWHTGGIMVLIGWLIIGGIFMVGGRGWCLFFCPLGAMSNLAHKAGSKLGMYRTEYDKTKCADCKGCKDLCPMWAINEDKSIETTLCINCKECVNLCPKGAYYMKWGRKNAGDAKQN